MARCCCSRRCVEGDLNVPCDYCGDECQLFELCEDVGGLGTNIVRFFRVVCDNGNEDTVNDYLPYGAPYVVQDEGNVGECPESVPGVCTYCGDNCITYELCENIGGLGTNYIRFFRLTCTNGLDTIITDYLPNGVPYVVLNPLDVGACIPNGGDADWYQVGTSLPPSNIGNNIYRTGDTAIGQVSPNYKLDIRDDSDSVVARVISSNINGAAILLEDAGAVISNKYIRSKDGLLEFLDDAYVNVRLAMNDVGNFGVNTTDIEDWNADYRVFEWAQSAILGGAFSGYPIEMVLAVNCYYDNSPDWYYKANGSASRLDLSSGTIGFYRAATGIIDTNIGWLQSLVVEQDGDVLIANSGSSDTKLTVVDTVGRPTQLKADTEAGDMINNPITTIRFDSADAQNTGIGSSIGFRGLDGADLSTFAFIRGYKSNNTSLNRSGSLRLSTYNNSTGWNFGTVMDELGNVGVNIAPIAKLHVFSTSIVSFVVEGNNALGSNIQITETGAVNGTKYIRSSGGNLEVIDNAYVNILIKILDNGTFIAPYSVVIGGPSIYALPVTIGTNANTAQISAMGHGIQYPNSATAFGISADMIGFGYSAPNLYGTINNAASCIIGTVSDYRVKEDITNITDAINKIKLLKPIEYNAIGGISFRRSIGFIAHEVQEALEYDLVTGEKDGVNEDGEPMYQSVNYAVLVSLLTKALQELTERVEILEGAV